MAHRRRRAFRQAAALALLALAVACRTPREAGPSPRASASAISAVSVSAPLPSLSGEFQVAPPLPELDVAADFVTLPVAGFRGAVVAVPTAKDRPLLAELIQKQFWQFQRDTEGSAGIPLPFR